MFNRLRMLQIQGQSQTSIPHLHRNEIETKAEKRKAFTLQNPASHQVTVSQFDLVNGFHAPTDYSKPRHSGQQRLGALILEIRAL